MACLNKDARAVVQMMVDALVEATNYTSCESWSPSMTRDCEKAVEAGRALLSQPAAQAVEADSERSFDFKAALSPTPISGWGQQPIGMSTAASRATVWLDRAIDLITAYRAAAVAPGNPPPHVEQDAMREIISHLRSHP